MNALRLFAPSLVDLVFPRSCAACEQRLVERGVQFCDFCVVQLATLVGGDYCHGCGADKPREILHDGRCTDCLERRPGYAGLYRAGRYHDCLRDMILRFKYSRRLWLDGVLGDLLADVAAGAPELARIRVWTSIPSPWRRNLARGAHLTQLLAARVAARVGGRCVRALRMARHVRQQKELPGDERIANVRGAFAVRDARAVLGHTIGLIDDICTTGATLREAARTLRDAGAKHVYALVVARASDQAGR